MLAQGMAVSTVAHEVEELLFLATGLALPIGKSDMRVTRGAVRFQGPMASPTGWMAFCTTTFLVKVALWALGEAPPVQQHVGRPAGCAVMRAFPQTLETGLVASFTEPRALQVKLGSTLGQTLARGYVCPRELLCLESCLGLPTLGAVRGLGTHTRLAGSMTGFAVPMVRVEALSTAR